MTMSDDPISFTVYMTPADEAPLLDFLRQDGGKIVRMFSSEWPPVPLKRPPEACGDDECLAVWYSDVISEAELEHPDCRPIRGRHGRFDAWSLPLVTFQRQWYWKKQATIFAVELDE